MAGQKLSPRQKMINMMYLVLIALLALNVSSEILNAFVVVNDGITETKESIKEKNDITYALLAELENTATESEKLYIDKAYEVKEITAQLYSEIQVYHDELVNRAGGYNDEGKIVQHDNLDIAANLMISEGNGKELQEKVKEAKAELLELLDEDDRQGFVLPLQLDDPENDEQNRDWASYTFEMVPVIASVTMLNQLQNDVRTAESDVINYLLNNIQLKGFKLDKINAQVHPRSNYILAGERYSASIFPAAYSSTVSPKVHIGRLDREMLETGDDGGFIPTEDSPLSQIFQSFDADQGKVQYEFQTNGAGIKTYEGAIEMTDKEGAITWYPFRSSYTVSKSSAVVSPDKMNVMYKNLDNPLSISVPGVTADRITATITNGVLTKQQDGKYSAKVGQAGLVKVNVSATMDDGSVRQMGTTEFRVKPVPKPVALIGNKSGGRTTKNELKAFGAIRGESNIIFNCPIKIKSYEFILQRGNGSQIFRSQNTGNKFTDRTSNLVESLKNGDKVFLENIEAVNCDGSTVKLAPLVFNVF